MPSMSISPSVNGNNNKINFADKRTWSVSHHSSCPLLPASFIFCCETAVFCVSLCWHPEQRCQPFGPHGPSVFPAPLGGDCWSRAPPATDWKPASPVVAPSFAQCWLLLRCWELVSLRRKFANWIKYLSLSNWLGFSPQLLWTEIIYHVLHS